MVRRYWVSRFDSPIMKIERVQDVHQLMKYVTTYATKATYFTVDIPAYLQLRKMKFFSSWLTKERVRPEREKFMLLCPSCRSVWGYLGVCGDSCSKWYFETYDYDEPLKTIT